MSNNSACPISSIACFFKNRSLISQYVKRAVAMRYRGSMFGVLWSLITPLLMLLVYSFVFTVVFQARWGVDTGAKGEFAIILFSGLILHAFFSECLTTAPSIILDNSNFVKKVIFPLEILAPTIVISAFFQLLISFLVLTIGIFVVYGTIPASIIMVPVVLLPFVLLTIGVSWILASLGVYIRDIAHVVGVLATVLLFISTIFYPASALSETLQMVIYANPLSFIVDQFREVAIYGKAINWEGYGIYSGISLVVYYLGFWWFQKTRNGFADVL